MKFPRRIAVLMGGTSGEREISLRTGRFVCETLSREGFRIFPVDVRGPGFILKLFEIRPDFVFVALHGPGGEDGSMQGCLSAIGLRYSGSGPMSSSLAMNKIYAKRLFASEGLRTPKAIILSRGKPHHPLSVQRTLASASERVVGSRRLGIQFPCVVKPCRQGSALGVSIVRSKRRLAEALSRAFRYDRLCLVEDYIPGVEVTASVLGEEPLPAIEILPQGEFYDYRSKYARGGSRHILPARLSARVYRRVQEMGLRAHRILGCVGMSRTDMIVRNGEIFVLETNSIPGMTSVSLFPEACRAAGYSMGEMLKRIIRSSLQARE